MTNAISALGGSSSAWTQHTAKAEAGKETVASDFFKKLVGARDDAEQASSAASEPSPEASEAKKLFREFAGQAMFGQALSSMRKTVDKSAYFHGGRTEEVFQQELDRKLVEEVTKKSGDRFVGPMFELFSLQQRTASRP